MSPSEYDYQLGRRLLVLRQRIGKFRQCCNFRTMAIQEALGPYCFEVLQATRRLECSNQQLAACLSRYETLQ